VDEECTFTPCYGEYRETINATISVPDPCITLPASYFDDLAGTYTLNPVADPATCKLSGYIYDAGEFQVWVFLNNSFAVYGKYDTPCGGGCGFTAPDEWWLPGGPDFAAEEESYPMREYYQEAPNRPVFILTRCDIQVSVST
jgi:hypothetical protein